MSVFSKKEILVGDSQLIPIIAKSIEYGFSIDGFEVVSDSLVSGGCDISITKGNIFKAVLGMRTALKVTLTPHPRGISFEANVGIFGQQAIPTVISLFFFWPVLISQIWGLVEQSKLDDKALSICKNAIYANSNYAKKEYTNASQCTSKYCSRCGTEVSIDAKFCPECGKMIN